MALSKTPEKEMCWVWVIRAFPRHRNGTLIQVPNHRARWLISHGFCQSASEHTRRISPPSATESETDMEDTHARRDAPPAPRAGEGYR